MQTLEEKIQRHQAFWQREPIDRPLVGFRIGDYLFANKFQAALPLLEEGKKIHPEMLEVDRFLEDYEGMYQESLEVSQDAFWTASPFTAIPWMEAMLGCEIRASEASFTSESWMKDLDEIEQIDLREEQNPWFRKYIEFVEKLTQLSQGRFPVGQPIMRGISDTIGALRGQTNFVFDLLDQSEHVHTLGRQITEIFRRMIQYHRHATTSVHDGYAMGFYHLWSPGPCIWFQEDLVALMSPALYQTYLFKLNQRICEGYDYTLCHLHPTAFFILDDLLQIDGLKTIEINKDIGGPSIEEMLPQFKKVLQHKRLVIWGDLNKNDLGLILEELPYEGLYLHIVAATIEEAKHLMQYIQENGENHDLKRTSYRGSQAY